MGSVVALGSLLMNYMYIDHCTELCLAVASFLPLNQVASILSLMSFKKVSKSQSSRLVLRRMSTERELHAERRARGPTFSCVVQSNGFVIIRWRQLLAYSQPLVLLRS